MQNWKVTKKKYFLHFLRFMQCISCDGSFYLNQEIFNVNCNTWEDISCVNWPNFFSHNWDPSLSINFCGRYMKVGTWIKLHVFTFESFKVIYISNFVYHFPLYKRYKKKRDDKVRYSIILVLQWGKPVRFKNEFVNNTSLMRQLGPFI